MPSNYTTYFDDARNSKSARNIDPTRVSVDEWLEAGVEMKAEKTCRIKKEKESSQQERPLQLSSASPASVDPSQRCGTTSTCDEIDSIEYRLQKERDKTEDGEVCQDIDHRGIQGKERGERKSIVILERSQNRTSGFDGMEAAYAGTSGSPPLDKYKKTARDRKTVKIWLKAG